MPSFRTPTQQQIETAVQRMRSPEFSAYFLSRLQNPKWIKPLHDGGLFRSPPPTVKVDEGRRRYPNWPESKYLARMAPLAPMEVAEIFTALETDNALVVGDLIEAALAMPCDCSITLVPAVCRAADAGALWIHYKDATDLCVHLAEGGEVAASMVLAEALFAPRFEEGQEEPSRRDQYWYKEGLMKVVPSLATRHGRQFIPRLCDWLRALIEARKDPDSDSGNDFSYVWRPAIEENEENKDYDYVGIMAGFVRRGFEEALVSGQLTLDAALQILEQYRYLVFERLRLHLINKWAEENPELARQTMLNRALFDDYRFKHEYGMLLGHRFVVLTPAERDTWFEWIEAGPDMSGFEESQRDPGREVTEEDKQKRILYWKFEKLHWVREHLETSWREFYISHLAEYGEPEFAYFNIRIGPVRCGRDSPVTVDDLAGKPFEQVVNMVSSWKPEEPPSRGADMEGLASTFRKYVKTDSEGHSKQARVMIDRRPVFVREFIGEMTDAIKDGRWTDIQSVLDLCVWVVSRPLNERTGREQDCTGLVDRDWQWTRDEISEFVQKTCVATEDEAPRYPLEGLREPLWEVVSALCKDRAKSYVVHDIRQDDPRVHDYLNLGINSPRGKAVGAALEYGRWVANHIKVLDGEQQVVPGGFESMPEVRAMLEWQIGKENRRVETLSIVGSKIGLIYWVDKVWLAENANRLFHLRGIEEEPPVTHGWAAWNAFLTWVRPHIEFYRLFKEQFAYAVVKTADVHINGRSREQPLNHLGEHLMILYGRGQLGLTDEDGLLGRFLSDAAPEIRRHAIGFVGQSLKGDEEVPRKVLQRFESLWEVYWSGSGKDDAAENPDAWLFGPWFASGHFPKKWSIERLEEFVEVVPTPEPDHAVAERLAAIAESDLARAVHILDRMIRGDREGWRIHAWLDSAKQILEKAMKAGSTVRQEAVKVIDYLGRRGFLEFGDLLKGNL